MSKNNAVEKVPIRAKAVQMAKNLPRWNTPSPGKKLTLREWLFYMVGGCGAMGSAMFLGFMTLSHGIYIAAALNVPVDHITIIGVITSLITILSSPFVSWLIDNTNTKYGKFRPYLIALPIPIVLGLVALGQVARIEDYNTMIITYSIIFNIVFLLNRIYGLAFGSLAQVMAPSMEERTQLMSIGTFFTSLGPTLVGMLYPSISNFLFGIDGIKDGDVVIAPPIAGVDTIDTAMLLVPIMAAVFFGLGLIMAFGVKERIVVSKNYKQKQKFTEGVRKVATNKYFWIQTSSNVVGILKAVAGGFAIWYINYIIRPELILAGNENIGDIMQAITMTLIGDACVPGMLLAPWVIKKIGLKKLILITNIVAALAVVPMIFIPNAWVGLACIYIYTLAIGFQIVANPACQAEINDYQQYKTGDRIEGFLSQFGGMGTAFVAPAIYKSNGYFDDVSVLYNEGVLYSIVSTMAIIACASGLLAAIPYLFWDLTEKRHKEMMEVLRIRAMHDDGDLDDETFERLQADAEAGNLNALTEYLKVINPEDRLEDTLTDDIYDNLDIDMHNTTIINGPEVVPGVENTEIGEYSIDKNDIEAEVVENADDKTE